MNRYGGLIKNDFAAAPGVSVTLFVQGCATRCPGCHNPELQDFNGGMEFGEWVIEEVLEALTANGIKRNLCIMGGEPLCLDGWTVAKPLVDAVREKLPETPIYIWTGYIIEEIIVVSEVKELLKNCDYLIDGPYIEAERDITLPMRGSRNQRIIDLKNYFQYNKNKKENFNEGKEA